MPTSRDSPLSRLDPNSARSDVPVPDGSKWSTPGDSVGTKRLPRWLERPGLFGPSNWIVHRNFVAALVAVVSLGIAGCSDDAGRSTQAGSTRSTQPGPVPADTNCASEPLPFHATYLPDGWNRDLQLGELKDYKEGDTFTTEGTKDWVGPGKEAIRVFRDPPGIELPVDPEPVSVLGGTGEVGEYPAWEDGVSFSADFSWCGSRWALVGAGGATLDDVRKVTEGLVPSDGNSS